MKKQMIAFITGFTVLFGATNLWAEPTGGDDWGIPLDFPLPFPWHSIEGIWKVDTAKLPAFFSFEVQHDCDNRKILTVLQLDPESRRVMAKGIGYLNESTLEVRAAMSAANNASFLLTVGAYNDTTKFPYKTVIALRITSFSDWSRLSTFRIYKIEPHAAKFMPEPLDTTTMPCRATISK